jgi:hypothetical protein
MPTRIGVGGAVLAAAALAALAPVPAAAGGRKHTLRANYSGTATGQASAAGASGSATAHGSGNLVGRGTLVGSGSGTFTSQTCVVFSGKAVLTGPAGTVELTASGARACVASATAGSVSFSGSAKVARGTKTFAGANGTLAFKGTFDRQAGTITVSFRGKIAYASKRA